MPWDFNLIATDCPPLVIPSALHDPASLTPKVLFGQQPGVPATLTTGLRSNAVCVENLGRYGTGAYAIAEGLELVAGAGLTVNINPGCAMIDGPLVKPVVSGGYAVEGLAVSPSVRSWIWLSQSGTFSVVATALTAPSPAAVCLGSVLMGASAITGNPDHSGRFELRGPLLWRRTADAGAPTDVPSARVAIYSRGPTNVYLWDGVGWIRINV